MSRSTSAESGSIHAKPVPEVIADRIKSNFFRLKDAVPTLIRSDYVRAIYLNMLQTLSRAEILSFWRSLPLTMNGRTLTDGELFRLLWTEGSKVPMIYDYCVGDCLEPFLINIGVDARAFLNGIFIHNNRSTYVSGKTVLSHLEPMVFGIFKYEDLKEGLLDLAHVHTENFLPGHKHRIAQVEPLPNGLKRVYMAYLTDESFRAVIPYDNDFLTGIALSNLPRMLSLEAFAPGAISNVCDSRPVEYVLWEDVPREWRGERLFLGGKAVGMRTSFHLFCRKLGLQLSPFGVPDWEVVEMAEDVRCPYRRRVVLRKGCAYAAPLYVQAITYPCEAHSSRRHLEAMVKDISLTPEEQVLPRHQDLIAFTGLARFTYYQDDSRLDFNDRVFIKGRAAQILSEVLAVYMASGGRRATFEFAYFKKEKGIHPGFEVHLRRVQEQLKNRKLAMRIVSAGKGTFRFETDVPVEITFVQATDRL